jgi:hypothetical protein
LYLLEGSKTPQILHKEVTDMKTVTKYEKFHIIKEVITIDGVTKPTYGIKNTEIKISDVSLNRTKVLKFCQLLNKSGGEKDINVLKDLIEDYFA